MAITDLGECFEFGANKNTIRCLKFDASSLKFDTFQRELS